ncbi:hypothetical protein [Nonomuraea gerenzanensis]|nr:hypothetical protein [Nonomuraea gerenzanensis]UBU09164.1 hypothetical protein LCN96_32890 [Nonomuraea gerenzanensis]
MWPTGQGLTARAAADAFLDTVANPNSVSAYAARVGKTALRLGEQRPLAAVADDEIGEALEALWGKAAVNTWNARRAAILSWLAWCREHGHAAPAVPAWARRLAAPDSQPPARSSTAIDRLITRRDVGVREKPSTGSCMRRPPGLRKSSPSTSRTWSCPPARHGSRPRAPAPGPAA